MKFELIETEKENFPVATLCRVLQVSSSGFYAWQKRPESGHEREDRRFAAHIRASFEESGRRYGSPRIHRDLKAQGEKIARKRVARLMREEALVARKVRRFVATTNSDHELPIAPNTLNRDFKAEAPNRKWVGDISYLRTSNGWLYLAVILDLFSRRVVGYALHDSLETVVASQALRMALATRNRHLNGLLFHSDRGVQ